MMAVAMAIDDFLCFDFDLGLSTAYGYSSTTTTTTTTTTTMAPTTAATSPATSEVEHGCNWNDWSPVVDWNAISGGEDGFHDLIESMMDDEGTMKLVEDREGCDSDAAMTMLLEEEAAGDDFKGLRLVHLLMAAAEALTGENKNHELVRVILVRLKELVSPAGSTNMERLAVYFTEGLQGLLDGGGGCGHGRQSMSNAMHHHPSNHHSQADILAAFQLMQDMSPYVKFGHFTANQAILEAVTQHRRVHIIDYDIMEGIQWASLMQALVSRKDSPLKPHLKITALSRSGGRHRSIGTVQETGRRLAAFAASIGQPFSFQQCRVESDETFHPSSLKLVKGEALIVNCMLHLAHISHRGTNSVVSFLEGAKSLNPRLVTLVEEETGPVEDHGFVSKFMDVLHHYSALYDSLEAGFPMQGRARALVERVFLGPRIAGSIARMYRGRGQDSGGDDGVGSWWEFMGESMGLVPVSLSFGNHCQARLLLGLFNDGYRVEELGSNRLVFGWKARRLLSAHVWTSPADSESD
ncbi:hypothetical protein MLD38_022446 [Melastoma candidum]|uniref:Uncharacterized protein n=1 Tax=Melastoma candidum TaxID=119954 RepID=A0ACB9QJF8_9MYRT|nr:hypothetical protein MLD38_022446 [Melastoma candidum]